MVIPVFNGLPWLREQLDALCEQAPPFAWEVVVADNGSSDASPQVVAGYQGRLTLTVVDASDRRGQAHARNVGVAASRGPRLVFLDQDDVVGPGYLAAMHDAIGEHGFVAAALESERLNPPWAVEAFGRTDGRLRAGRYPRAAGGALGVRRDLFEAVAGFDPGILGAAEDDDFTRRVQCETGVELRLCPSATLHYRYKPTLAAVFAQGRAYGRAGPVFYRKWASCGEPRLAWPRLARRWASAAKLIVVGPGKGRRAAGLFLLGTNIGRLEGSCRYRVWYP